MFWSARYCGQDGEVGGYHRDEIRNITGRTFGFHAKVIGDTYGGVGALELVAQSVSAAQKGESAYGSYITFDASRVVPIGPENVPSHYRQPIALYLGKSPQI